MRKRVVPDEATTDDVMAIFGWSRSEVSRRRRSGDLPEPDPWRGSERKPRWSREVIMSTLARLGLLDGVVLAAFEGDLSSPVRWHRAHVANEFVRLPQMQLHGDEERHHLYRVVRYLRRDDGPAFADTPEFQLSLCIAVDDPNPHRVFNGMRVRSEVAHALGYGTGEAGTIAVIVPADDGDNPQLWFARIPAEFPDDHIIHLEQIPAEQIPVAAHLLGHPLPAWTTQEITHAGISLWNPEEWAPEHWQDGAPVPVELSVPRALAAGNKFERRGELLLERIEAGQISAPADVPDSLRGLMFRAKESTLMTMRRRRELASGWSWLFQLPARPDSGWPQTDMAPALRWLATSSDVPTEAAEFATRYFGYDASVTVALLDLTELTGTARSAVERALMPVDSQESWLTTALRRRLRAVGLGEGCQQYRWAADPDPQSHPVIRCGDVVAFHVPRAMFPTSAPDYVEVVATTLDGSTEYTGFLVDLDGGVTPLVIRPDDRDFVAGALTAAVWAPTAELMMGAQKVIGNPPAAVRQLTAILNAGETLHLDWDELATATGPGPGPHADWQDLLTWHDKKPPIQPK